MAYPHDTTLEADYQSENETRIIEQSLRQEIGEIDDERSQTTISREECTLSIQIHAKDLVALRAALNTWLSLLAVAEETASIGRERSS